MVGNPDDLDPALENAMLCVGMVGFANMFGSLLESQLARQRYVNALWHTNVNLRDSTKVRDDRTLVAIFLLGLFEV